MELSYWQSRWKKDKTGFHMDEGYPGLEKHWASLSLPDQPVVLVPLCGKSKDLIWMSRSCKKVIGVEISEVAIRGFLSENGLDASEDLIAGFKRFMAGNITLWQGDFFKLPKQKLPSFDLIFDKAAIVALPLPMRDRYEAKLKEIVSDRTKILIHHYEYNQNEMNGPPFSVPPNEIEYRFDSLFSIKELERNQLNLNWYKKFQKRGLQNNFIEYLSLLLPKRKNNRN